jgi:hypothetical protein
MRITFVGAVLIAAAIIGAIALIHYLGDRGYRGVQQTENQMVIIRDETAELASDSPLPEDPCSEGQCE